VTPNRWIDEAETPLGRLGFEVSDAAVLRCWFADQPPTALNSRPATAPTAKAKAIAARLKTELSEYFSCTRQAFSVPLAPQGTPFQQAVWETLQAIPYAHTITYSAQAASLGRSRAVRAVANANGANPLPVLIPCHRVVAKNGGLGGYGPGIDRKVWLLEHEQ